MTEPMVFESRNGLKLGRFAHFSRFAGLRHGVFARSGGASPAPYASLNTAKSVGDDPDCVARNRRKIQAVLGGNLVFARQVHGTEAVVLARSDGPPDLRPQKADALITDIAGLTLVIQVADCQPVFLYDPVKQVVANIHSGWRGSVQNIIGATIATMKTVFKSRATHILAGIGPSLGPCCAEFVRYQSEIPQRYWRYKDARHRFDFWAISQDQLAKAGVPAANIALAGWCSKCHPELFFSYRGEKETGRFAAAIGLCKR